MNSAASEPALIGLDWGTSSLRAYLIAGDGTVVDRVSRPEGIMRVPDRNFDAVFDAVIAPWLRDGATPVIASGMITSRNGWVETPYCTVPSAAKDLAAALVPHRSTSGQALHFITGATTEHNDGPDVMRGEETQIIGAAALGLSNGTFVMPGTHSKWVEVEDGGIKDYATYMTGEVFAALKEHTILGTLIEDGPFAEEAFLKGVESGLGAGSKLLNRLFHVRSLPLMGRIGGVEAGDYLSGLLIGSEISGALGPEAGSIPITIVGRSDLAFRYDLALRSAGWTTSEAPEDVAAMGHYVIARAAGLMS